MKSLITLIVILISATTSFAAEISEREVTTFLNDWLVAQNTGPYSKYAAMYSGNFVGIRRSGTSTVKLDHGAWLKERKRMFVKKVAVTSNVPEIILSGTTATAKFEQTWESGTYKDKGIKLLQLEVESGKLKIIREEMLFSKLQLGANTGQDSSKSKFTSMKDNDCKELKSSDMLLFFGSEYVLECPAPKGWRLFKEYDLERIRSWIRLSYGSSIWSTINQVWGDEKYEFGHFPNIDNNYVEWRISGTGEPSALIFRVHAQDPENSSSVLTRLFVISLTNNIPRFCGMAKTNEEAKEIADKATTCTTILEKGTLPKRQ